MRSGRLPCWAWLLPWSAWACLQAPLAAGQEPPFPLRSQLTADVRTRLAEAAQDPTLAPWQREFMLEVARGRPRGAAPQASPILPGVWRTMGTAADDGVWTALPPPSPRHLHTAIYDPVRDRIVVFGGWDGSKACNDVWALSLAGSPAWHALAPAGTAPSARYEHTAIYDPVRDRMMVFGGAHYDGSLHILNDVWALSLAGSPVWSELAPAGTPPSARYDHTAIYDPVRDRMVLFGGYGGGYRNDVWALSLAGSPAWSELTPAGTPPSARWRHAAIYDPARDRMVMFGGVNFTGFFNDVWVLSLAGGPAWSELAPSGTPPSARYEHTAIYDPVGDRMVVFGGWDGLDHLNDVWALSLADRPAWGALATAGSPPSAREDDTAIYDPVREGMVVFGGYDGINLRNDVWALSLTESPAWSLAETAPSARLGHTAIYDPVRDRMVVFGGRDGTNRDDDVWALSLADTPAWGALDPAGSPPSARSQHTVIYDPVRDRMVVFGGFDGSYLTDVWELSLAGSQAWSALTPSGSPPSARRGHTAIYDPVQDRMLVFGGWDGGSFLNDVWELSLAGGPAWSALTPAGSPPSARYGHTSIYDPVRDRMVVFGGYDGTTYRDDLWQLSLAGSPAWSALAPTGTPPSARSFHTSIYDPVRDRMVVFGGNGDTGLRNDAWALSLGGSPAWSALAPTGTPPYARYAHTAIHDPVRDRMVVFGGYGGTRYRNDGGALEWGAPVFVPPDADGHPRWFELAPPWPNPSRGETTLDFELAKPARVVLEVLDISGRRVKRIADEWFPAGRHAKMWRGDDERGHAVTNGVYFIRMRCGGFEATRRTVRVR